MAVLHISRLYFVDTTSQRLLVIHIPDMQQKHHSVITGKNQKGAFTAVGTIIVVVNETKTF